MDAAVLTMAACSAVGRSAGASGNATAHSATGTPVVWVGNDPTDAFMVQIMRQGATLSGTFDDTGLPNVGATTTTPLHASFTGTLDGTAMTLTFGGLLGSTSIVGTLTTDTMTLRLPQNDGSIASLTLKPSTVDDYNRKVAAIRDTAGANAQASMAAAARQANQAQIDSAADTVARDITQLAAANHTPDFSAFDRDIASANNDLAQTKADAARAAGESDSGTACYDAGAADYDAGTVQYESGVIDYDASAIGSDADAVTSAVNAINSDLATYQQTAAALPGLVPANPPNSTAIKSLVDGATKAASEWKAKAAQYQTQVAQLVNQANAIAAQAQKQYC